MNINRHNYEEFFLLYVDGELTETERAAVELFVQQNGDLAEEMEMLKQAVLPVENMEFEQKENLYNSAKGISIDNYNEYFLLAVDNELTKQESDEVEKFVLTHPELQTPFILLKQTRLEAEPIIYSGKEKLYKKERKERPVIFVNWARMAVAAAMIGVAVMSWFFFQKNTDDHTNHIVSTFDNPVKRLPSKLKEVKRMGLLMDRSLTAVTAKEKAEKATTTKTNAFKILRVVERNDAFASNGIKNKPSQIVGLKVKDEKTAETLVQDKKAFEEIIASARIDNSSNTNNVKNDAKNDKIVDKLLPEQANPVTKQAVYKELNTREDDEEKSIYIGSAQINKSKLKGLFKKATSFLGARNDDNDGEKTFKIAGFEIKSK